MSTRHTNTLQNLFPEPRAIPRKNFIRENVRHIKEIQGIIQNSMKYKVSTHDKYRNVPQGISSNSLPRNRSGPLKSTMLHNRGRNSSNRSLNKAKAIPEKSKLQIHQLKDLGVTQEKLNMLIHEEKRTDRSVQTEKSNDIKDIYENGVIKYASAYVMKNIKQNKMRAQAMNAYGDSPSKTNRDDKIDTLFRNINLDGEKNFLKENIVNTKQKQNKTDGELDPNRAPPNYKKGVVPKYLQEQKKEDEKVAQIDHDCPHGHVLLPDEERKETLRVLRQSYADRIQELNSMPVRNDTFRMRKRKMEIEEELKKIDEGIKVFQRPKVFVKINA